MAAKLFLLGFLIVQVSCGENSLTFVIDETGSMYNDIQQVKSAAKSIVDIVLHEKSSQIEDIVLVTFNDPGLGRLRKKTRDANELKRALDSIDVGGGGDCPENSLSGIKKGLEESRPGSYLYVFTDASAKDFSLVNEIKTLCQEKQSQVVFVLTGHCGDHDQDSYKVYHHIAEASNGQVFDISKDDVGKVLDCIKETIKGDRDVSVRVTIPANTWRDIQFNIDDQTEYAIVSATGTHVNLHVVNPIGDSVAGKRITWINNLKVLKLGNLPPGTYTAKVRGNSKVNIIVFGRTDFTFQHGFSTEPKTSLKGTDPQPTTGVQTHLIVSVQDKAHSANIREVELRNMADRVVMTLPLTHVAGDVYKTDKFLSPQHTFKIAVVGTSKKSGTTVKRVAKTPVTPIQSVAPEIYKNDKLVKVKEGGSVDLHCRMNKGKPMPQISWYVKKQGAADFTRLKDTDDVIHVTNALTNDHYMCVANNVAGNDEHTMQLDVQVAPKFQNKRDAITKKEGEPATIDCKLQKGNPRPEITWTFKPRDAESYRPMRHEGDVLSISATQIKHSGHYRCVANNAEGWDDKITELLIKAKPEIHKLPPVQSVMENATVNLQCRTTNGFPEPTVNWFYKGPYSNEYESRKTDQIRIGSVRLSDAGQYMCVAENEVGRQELVVRLVVNAPPRIVFEEYIGVEGDIAAWLPCTAVGHPAPTITWKVDERTISTDNSKNLYVEGNALVLLHPKSADSTNKSHNYVCYASNEFGRAVQPYTVFIQEHVDWTEPNGTQYGVIGQPFDAVCPLTFKDPSSVRWYNYNLNLNKTGPKLHFVNGDTAHSSNYTCRVSDMSGRPISRTIQVIFGRPPTKAKTMNDIEWNGYKKGLIIEFDVQPILDMNYEWFHNGQKLEQHSESIAISNWGEYTCRVSNPLGSLLITWKVHAKDCGITKSLLKKSNAPIILDSSLSWPELSSREENIFVPHGEKLQLICPDNTNVKTFPTNGFTKFPALKSVYATCDHEDFFLVDGVLRKISELGCKHSAILGVVATGKPCQGGNTELMRVGFHVNGLTEVYQSCIDKTKNVPLYTKMNTIPVADESEPIVSGSKAAKQLCFDECCYENIQLVNAEDVSFGPAEKTTAIDYLNSVKYCKPKNGTTWHDIEKLAKSSTQYTVWSGAAQYTKVGTDWTPKYLWKLLKETDSSEQVVVIHANTQTAEPKLCDGKCGVDFEWFEPWGNRTYCCSQADFKAAFGVNIDFDEK